MTTRVVYSIASTLWIVLALANGKYAESKNDRGYKWFLLSLWLGPLATILIAARPTLDRPPDHRRISRFFNL